MKYSAYRALGFLLVWLLAQTVLAIEIAVDYTYDTQNFFDTVEKRNALERAAGRYSRVIDSSLLAVSPQDSSPGWRIGFSHPGTGETIQISTAASAATDPITSAPADVYGFDGLEEDTWILYAGGRNLTSAGIGGTGTGVNFTTTFDDFDGPMHRGLIPNTPGNSVNDLPVWGGAVAFDSDLSWHFDLDSVAPFGDLDFYTIALHEIGHALGLSSNWNQWTDDVSGAAYNGVHAVAAYNQDNSTVVRELSLQSSTDLHWLDGGHDSFIFPLGAPMQVGTVAAGQLQDLLMEPVANFSPAVGRFELTNVDAGGLVDVGWSILSVSSLDRDGDGDVDPADVDLACAPGADLSGYFDALGALPGDLDLDGRVDFADFLTLSANWARAGVRYSEGDVDCNHQVEFADFLTLSSNFGQAAVAARPVPEPHVLPYMLATMMGWPLLRRRR